MSTTAAKVAFMHNTGKVVVVGGGIGGLALGAGLRRRGCEVAVYDRDTDVTATGGYHITLDERAQTALRSLVEPEIMRRLLASGSALRLRERDVFRDHRGRVLGHGPDLRDSASIDVDRITLRTLLAEAVGDDLHLGRTVSGAEPGRVLFTDGTSTAAELVVGADGAHSVIARQLAGGPTSRPAGIIGFSGRTNVADLSEAGQWGPRSGFAIGPRASALYVGFLDPVGNTALDAPELRMSVTTGPTYIWGAMLAESAETEALRDLRGERLQAALLDRFRERGWAMLEVIERSAPETVAAFRFHAASIDAADLAPWPAGRVTALGDAVHATPPTAGQGAGAAIRDAAGLIEQLGSAAGLTEAVASFEADMRQRGSEVLTLGMHTVQRILAAP
ncbi:FAD-dependent oxidoreductase [Amycolatopsis albispora]|uniref:FAD-binding monooxygenase n=1 Tax=Amycolatopsis albispora TaxID=1804986 RepID=A0A344LBR1_9PSEU|nr:FAD-dependent monooxygenase [Amycolatopsis albispora]AXB45485.1 FAD-binding monooxygenase [Amycolatopsis albispora]